MSNNLPKDSIVQRGAFSKSRASILISHLYPVATSTVNLLNINNQTLSVRKNIMVVTDPLELRCLT